MKTHRWTTLGWFSILNKDVDDDNRWSFSCWQMSWLPRLLNHLHPYKILTLTPLEWFQLIQIFDAPLTQWRTSLTSCRPKSGKAFVLNDHTKLSLKNQVVQINKASIFKEYIYLEIWSRYDTNPTAQAKFEEHYSDACFDWHNIYKLPFRVLTDTKSREFQSKILNRYLTTNSFLHKIGLATSPLCRLHSVNEREWIPWAFIYYLFFLVGPY